jgi:hypothetical protein
MLALALGVAGLFGATAASAQDCGPDLQKLAKAREDQLVIINNLVKAAKGKQLDPELFCVKSAPLNTAENALIGYMEKNKDWCSVPDDAINQLKENHAKSVAFAGKACTVAAKIKKMKEQAAQGGGPQAQPLPSGPL